jgi:hypothetical protein
MNRLTDSPVFIFALTFFGLWFTTHLGASLLRRVLPLKENIRDDFGTILAASLTLLGLIIGFSYSMATSRYDQRNNYEASEANAISTEYVRASLLPAADAAKVRMLLRAYIDQRVLFYRVRDEQEVLQINARTAQLQNALWSAVSAPAAGQPTPIVALAVWGMSDVLSAQGNAQAAWWNRIPPAAWYLMAAIAICCNLMIGYGTRDAKVGGLLQVVLPLLVSISFFLIADIDSPRNGVIRLSPLNLEALVELQSAN